jgi:hypothetical protein
MSLAASPSSFVLRNNPMPRSMMTFSLPWALLKSIFGVVDEVAMGWPYQFCAPSCELPR